MQPRAWIFACLTALLLLGSARAEAGEGGELPATARRALQSLFARQAELGACERLTIPFSYPQRPTIFLESRGATLPMLFDTGAFTSIFIDDGLYLDPGVKPIRADAGAAGLDGKQQWQAYGYLELSKLGSIRVRNLPFRLYAGAADSGRDFAGAIAPIYFQQFLIEVNNTRGEIVLHSRSSWQPDSPAVVLPLVTLTRGTFANLQLSGHSLWFHLDSGFSGTLGVLPATLQANPEWFTAGEGEAELFQTWGAPVSCSPLTVNELNIPVYGSYSWCATDPLALFNLPALEYPGDYADVDELEVGGIVGSGFLSRFDYVIDYSAARLYLFPAS